MRLMDVGMQPVVDVQGYAIFTGCEGEDARFQAFLVNQDQAEALTSLMRVSRWDGDVQCVLAVLTGDLGLVTADDFEIKTHQELEQRITNARAAGIET